MILQSHQLTLVQLNVKYNQREDKSMTEGSLVQLKSGGPIMTVEDIDIDDSVTCIWFEKDENGNAIFRKIKIASKYLLNSKDGF